MNLSYRKIAKQACMYVRVKLNNKEFHEESFRTYLIFCLNFSINWGFRVVALSAQTSLTPGRTPPLTLTLHLHQKPTLREGGGGSRPTEAFMRLRRVSFVMLLPTPTERSSGDNSSMRPAPCTKARCVVLLLLSLLLLLLLLFPHQLSHKGVRGHTKGGYRSCAHQ